MEGAIPMRIEDLMKLSTNTITLSGRPKEEYDDLIKEKLDEYDNWIKECLE